MFKGSEYTEQDDTLLRQMIAEMESNAPFSSATGMPAPSEAPKLDPDPARMAPRPSERAK